MNKHDGTVTRRRAFGLFIAASALLLPGCGRSYKRYRFRLKLEIDTPSGLRSGSSVYEFEHGGKIAWLPGGDTYTTRIRGEALAVELQRGQSIYWLMQPDSDRLFQIMLLDGEAAPPIDKSEMDSWPWSRVKLLESLSNDQTTLVLQGNQTKSLKAIATGGWPLMVRFRNPNDPRTIELLEPANLAAGFGSGFGLKSVTLAMTDDEMTTGLEKTLPWLPSVNEKNLGANFKPKGIPVGDFQHLFSTEFMR